MLDDSLIRLRAAEFCARLNEAKKSIDVLLKSATSWFIYTYSIRDVSRLSHQCRCYQCIREAR